MADGMEAIDRCQHYARVFAHLDRKSASFTYWFLFVGNISLLMLSSFQWARDSAKLQGLEERLGPRAVKAQMRRTLLICGAYGAVSVTSVVLEVFALLGIQFCQQEDLMGLYWASWTTLQVGSTVAILGILLAAAYQLMPLTAPPWALALGTPILVAGGIAHAVSGTAKVQAKRFIRGPLLRARRSFSSMRRRIGPSRSGSDEENAIDLPMSRAQTLRADDDEYDDLDASRMRSTCTSRRNSLDAAEIPAKFLGYTESGNPILRFDAASAPQIDSDRGEVLGRAHNGDVIVMFRKGMTVVTGTPGGGNTPQRVASTTPTPPPLRSPFSPPPMSPTPTLFGTPSRSGSPVRKGPSSYNNNKQPSDMVARLQAALALDEDAVAIDDIERQKSLNRAAEKTAASRTDAADPNTPENRLSPPPQSPQTPQEPEHALLHPRARSIRIVHHPSPRKDSSPRRGGW